MKHNKLSFLRWLFISASVNQLSPIQKVLTYSILVFWASVVIFPLYWLFITSFKLPIHVSDGPFYIPFVDFEPSLHAWKYIFIDIGKDTLRPYLNSIVIALVSTVFTVIFGSMAAYALTRIEYKPKLGSIIGFIGFLALVIVLTVNVGLAWQLSLTIGVALFLLFVSAFSKHFTRTLGNDDILFWIISQRIMPPVVSVLPIYIMFQQTGLLDTHFALIVTYMAVNIPIAVWLMRDFFSRIPVDLEESAMLDGASRMRVFLTIYMPLAKPGLAATCMLVFILSWNEYLLALFLSTVDAQTMPLMVAAQNATRGPQWWYMSVLIVVMIIPVIVLAGVLGKLINKGQLTGAVKG